MHIRYKVHSNYSNMNNRFSESNLFDGDLNRIPGTDIK